MTNRNSSPDAAFAYVGKINGVAFKLLRHHKLDTVKDGNEHDTVDQALLVACLRMIDQVPVSTEKREEIRAHLMAHANFIRDVKNPDVAQKIINQKDSGDFKFANKTLNDTEMGFAAEPNFVPGTGADKVETPEVKLQAAPKENEPIKDADNIVNAGLVQQDGEAPQSNPNQEGVASDKPNPAGNGGDGKQIVTDDNAIEVSNPNTDKLGKASLNNATVTEEDKKKDELKVDSADQSVKTQNDLPDSSFAVIEKGGKKDASGKTVPRSYRHLPYKDASGKIDLPHLRNALARMNQIKAVSPKDSTERIRAVARKVLVAAAKKALPNTKFSKNSVNDEQFNAEAAVAEIDQLVEAARYKKKSLKHKAKKKPHGGMISYNIYLNKENKVIVSKETLQDAELLATAYASAEIKEFAGLVIATDLTPPTPEEQNQGGAVLTTDTEGETGNPNTDKVGLASLIATKDDLTDAGRKFILSQLGLAIHGKVEAKIHSIDKMGSVEMMNVKVGNSKEFPMYLMLDISKDSKGNVTRVKLWNESLPGEALADFAKFLNGLSKDVATPVTAADLATAPPKLERCVADVYPQRVANFKKKNGRAPNAKEQEKLKSSAWAICRSSLKV